jgi:antitoxin VapB
LQREQRKRGDSKRLVEEMMEIGRHFAGLPVLDSRSPDEILGYDEDGLPH